MANSGLVESIKRLFGLEGAEEEPELGVTWMLLPPYDIPGMAVVSGLLVENQGQEAAPNVSIGLTYAGERAITHMEVVSDEPYNLEGGGPRDSHVMLQLAQLGAGKKVVVYVAGHNVQTPEVTVALQAAPDRA